MAKSQSNKIVSLQTFRDLKKKGEKFAALTSYIKINVKVIFYFKWLNRNLIK